MSITSYINAIDSPHRQSFFNEALSLGITIEIVSKKHKLTKFSFKDISFFLIDDRISFNTKTTAQITKDKEVTKKVLTTQGLCTPKGIETDNSNLVKEIISNGKLTFPLVVKPVDGARGIGVSVDLKNFQDVKAAINSLENLRENKELMISDNYIVEEMFYGNDHRILILNNHVIACAKRTPAQITGDGITNINDLIVAYNNNRHKSHLLVIDKDVTNTLQEENLEVGSILEKGRILPLRKNANISSGGIATDFTNTISDRFKEICINASKSVNGKFIGIDLFTNDITSEDTQQKYTIIEINGVPGYAIHEKPIINGEGINISKKLLESLFPNLLQ